MPETHSSQLNRRIGILSARRSYQLLSARTRRYAFSISLLDHALSILDYYLYHLLILAYLPTEFTDHQRNVFCVFSGEGVNRLRNYLNDDPTGIYDTESTMYDDHELVDGDNDHQVGSLRINDDDDVDDDPDGGDGSDDGAQAEG